MPRESARALRWQKTLARYDGFVFVVAEYNHSITGVLKNALDHAYKEWERKPFTAIGYGGTGAARPVEHLRLIAIALRMVSTAASVHIGGGDFMSTSPMGANKPIGVIEASLLAATKSALDELAWWARATMAAKAADHPNGETKMTNILFVGQKPETVDFSDPSLPPGFDAEKINAGIALGVKKIEEHGWKADTCMITPDAAGSAMLEKALTDANYDCVVIGGGLRLPPKGLVLFETVVNIIHKAAPNATIAFNTRPEDTADAAARQIKAG